MLEKVVDTRIERHLFDSGLHEELQSAYRRSHSTETALLKVQSDILESLDNCCVTVLVMLDLSAAFDTRSWSLVESLWECIGNLRSRSQMDSIVPYRPLLGSGHK